MAVKGLDIFQEYFSDYEGSFLLIGGAACDDWFNAQGLRFRATEDLDIVLILEALTAPFISRLFEFIEEGEYRNRNRIENGPPILYRFSKPVNPVYPDMLEIFSRSNDSLLLRKNQRIVPVFIDSADSLSAILLDREYYEFLLGHHRTANGIWMADVSALIPLKARAWLDLSARRERGESVDNRKIRKHRNDVFSLASTLPSTPGERLPASISLDVLEFLDHFPIESHEWQAILQAMKNVLGGRFDPKALSDAIRTYFQLAV